MRIVQNLILEADLSKTKDIILNRAKLSSNSYASTRYILDISKNFDIIISNIKTVKRVKMDFKNKGLFFLNPGKNSYVRDGAKYLLKFKYDSLPCGAYPYGGYIDLRWREILSIPIHPKNKESLEDQLALTIPMFAYHGNTEEEAELNYAKRQINYIMDTFS